LSFGNCCTVANLKLPKFPAFKQDALNICWRDCDVDSLFNCTAEWSRPFGAGLGPNPPPCGQFLSRLRMTDPTTGVLKFHGSMNLTYSRTWLETDTAGNNHQVWRFLVNGDLRATANAGLIPCPVPSCTQAFNQKFRVTGYVDYALDCQPPTQPVPFPAPPPRFSQAWMLTHSCDVVDHAPNFPRAGFFHFNRAYTFVGPAGGFAISPILPIESGGTSLEAVRRIRLPGAAPGPVVCEFEEQIDAGLDPLQELCLCGFPTAPMQYAISDLGLASSCGTSIFTPGGPFLPGFTSMGIGSWTDLTTYPGVEQLRWSTGGYDYFDPCVGLTRQEVFFGVTTIGGWFASQITSFGVGLPLPPTFVDQANSLRGGATTMNVPYVSDHIINLNFP
jgi:hypothetical protein